MVKRKFEDYLKIFNFLSEAVKEATGEVFRPKNVHTDCEAAILQCIKQMFPETSCILCSFHLARNFMEQLKKKVSGSFFENSSLLRVFRILIGSIYLNLKIPEIRFKIITYLKSISDRLCDKNLASKLQVYLTYIEKMYICVVYLCCLYLTVMKLHNL